MANTFRYFNLKQMSSALNGLGISWDVKMVVDLRELSDWGNITAGGDSFPHKGASLSKGNFLSTEFSLGSITGVSSNDGTYFGKSESMDLGGIA
tara:strand:- start:16440 stop:16721 length:282 start_codon:yes stop_codon:yes gene_type:complete